MISIVNIARFSAAPGMEQDLQEALMAVVPATRDEAGCLLYDLVSADSGELVMIETWADQAAIEAHLAQPYIAELLPRLGDLLAHAPQVETFRKLI